MPRKIEGRPRVGVNISVSNGEKEAIRSESRRAYKPQVAVVRDALAWVLALDERDYARAVSGRVPERDSVLYVELPERDFARAAALVGRDGVANLVRRACLKYLALPLEDRA